MPDDLGRVGVVVFAKTACPGTVKTRLIPALGPHRAADSHQALLDATLARVARMACASRTLALTPDRACKATSPQAHAVDRIVPQGAGDLGQRLARVTDALFTMESSPLIVLGADAPDLPLEIIQQAAASVVKGRFAISRSRDGGYCLIALPRPAPELFTRISWGGPLVADQTRAAADRAGLELVELEPWEDIDTIDDVKRLIERLRNVGDEALQRLRERLISATLKSGKRVTTDGGD